MDTQSWPWELASRCLKTERQKKSARKKDYHKKLIRLYKLRDELWMLRRALPMVPLEEPYQRGWKRSFVLREDVARSAKAAFYADLLRKINTVLYSHDKGFQKKKRRFRKRVYVDRPQYPRSYYLYEWYGQQCKLTELERVHFHLVEEVRPNRSARPQGGLPGSKTLVYKYVFSEPWRFVLKVEPHMITHQKMVDEVLEQRISQLENYIQVRNLSPVMMRAVYGDSGRWRNDETGPVYRDPLKNVPLHQVLAACLDGETGSKGEVDSW